MCVYQGVEKPDWASDGMEPSGALVEFQLLLEMVQSRVCLLRNHGDPDFRVCADVQVGVEWDLEKDRDARNEYLFGDLEGNIPSASTAASQVIADCEDVRPRGCPAALHLGLWVSLADAESAWRRKRNLE